MFLPIRKLFEIRIRKALKKACTWSYFSRLSRINLKSVQRLIIAAIYLEKIGGKADRFLWAAFFCRCKKPTLMAAPDT